MDVSFNILPIIHSYNQSEIVNKDQFQIPLQKVGNTTLGHHHKGKSSRCATFSCFSRLDHPLKLP